MDCKNIKRYLMYIWQSYNTGYTVNLLVRRIHPKAIFLEIGAKNIYRNFLPELVYIEFVPGSTTCQDESNI